MIQITRMVLIVLIGTGALMPWGSALSQDSAGSGVSALDEKQMKAVEGTGPSVVSIRVSRRKDDPEYEIRTSVSPFSTRPDAPVSGAVIGSDGYLVTSYFNVSGELEKIDVTFHDGRTLPAKRVGYSKKYDLALLKVEARDLAALKTAATSSLPLGQMVLAFGRSPDGKTPTVASGIVSALGRFNGVFIQIDARVNYGTVGGPVTDLSGRWLGITCRISTNDADTWGQNSGVSFVLPWETIESVLPKLKEGKEEGLAAYLGVSPMEEETKEIKVAVMTGSPASKGGLQNGDIVLAFDGKKVETFDALRDAILTKSAGDTVTVRIRRADKEKEVKVKLGAR